MTIQDLGSLGELIAVVATVVMLVYLAFQLKQNTRTLRSQTLQQSSMGISLTANAKSSDGKLARIVGKASNRLNDLQLEEHIRFHYWIMVAFRRFEAIYVKGI